MILICVKILLLVAACLAQNPVVNNVTVQNPQIVSYLNMTDFVVPRNLDLTHWIKRNNSNSTFDFVCKNADMATERCDSGCLRWPSAVRCFGDASFCKFYQCTTDFPECYCSIKNSSEVLESLSPPGIVKSYRYDPPAQDSPGPGNSDFGRSQNPRLVSSGDITIQLHEKVLYITCTEEEVLRAVIRKRKFSQVWSFNTSWEGNLPDGLWVTSDYLTVEVWDDDVLVASREFWIVGESICVVKDCLLCVQSLRSLSCMTKSQKLFVLCLVLLVFVLVLAFMPAVALMFVWTLAALVNIFTSILWFVAGIPRSQFVSDILCIILKFWKKKEYFSSKRDLEEGSPARQEPPRGRSGRPSRVPAWFTATVLISCLIGLSASCDSGIFVTGSFTNCVRLSYSKEECSFTSQSLISLNNIGSKACISFIDSIGNDTVQTAEMTFTSQVLTATLSTQYATSDWGGYQESWRYCADTGSCPGQCDPIYPSKDDCPHIKTGEVLWWPGKATCSRNRDGCAGNGCFSCASPCVFSAYSLVPFGTEYEVKQIEKLSRKVTVTLNVSGSSQSATVSTPVTIGAFRLSVVGSLDSSPIFFGTDKVIYGGDLKSYIGPAALANQPVRGGVGDIQAPTKAVLKTASESAFVYDRSIVTKEEREKSTIYTFGASGIGVLSAYCKFPCTKFGEIWRMQNGIMSSSTLVAAPVLITLETDANFKVSRTLNKVCPWVKVIKATGCYNCSQGIMIEVEAWSTCLPGTATVVNSMNNIELATTSLTLTEAKQRFNISAYTVKPSFSGSLCLKSGADSKCSDFSATFTSHDVIVVNNTETEGNRTVGIKKASFDVGDIFKDPIGEFGDIFEDVAKGVAKPLTSFLFSAMIIGGTVLVGGAAVLVSLKYLPDKYNLLRKMRTQKKTKLI